MLHDREYAAFCDAALGRFPHRTPGPAMTADGAAENRSGTLRATFRYAREDEPGGAGPLPLLFRVDQELAVAGGRHYLADCGGRGVCYELKGTICLQHLGGPGKAPGDGTWTLRRHVPPEGGVSAEGLGCGGGCGSGS